MRTRRTGIIAWAVVGLLVTLIAVTGRGIYVLNASDVDIRSIPIKNLLIDILGLHRFALIGLAGGAVIGVVESLCWGLKQKLQGERLAGGDHSQLEDPGEKIQHMRESRAKNYLNLRQQAREAAGAGQGPPIENVVTADNGRHIYRVMAYRQLSMAEAQQAVKQALDQGIVEQPEAGQSVVLLTDIGKHSGAEMPTGNHEPRV